MQSQCAWSKLHHWLVRCVSNLNRNAQRLGRRGAAAAPCVGRDTRVRRLQRQSCMDESDRLERLDRFVRRMNEVERDLTSDYVRPKDAATLILIDRSGKKPKVLLGKRHQRHRFMPGTFVFPGGRVDRSDRLMPLARPLDPSADTQLMKRVQGPSAAKARAFALAAIRETFEETGLVLGTKSDQAGSAPNGVWKTF